MPSEQSGARGAPGEAPDTFGPVKRHLTHHTEDHESGWQEPAEVAGRVPPLRKDRAIPRQSLAERFLHRVAEAERGEPRGR